MDEQFCVFCKIIHKELPARIAHEDDSLIVIHDRAPRAPIHLLIIPKDHIVNLFELNSSHEKIAYGMLAITQRLAQLFNIKAFNLVSNNGADAGQIVFHMHWHFLSGVPLRQIALQGL